MKYLRIVDDTVVEILPEFDPTFPGIPLDQRFTAQFVAECVPVKDDFEVVTGMLWDKRKKTCHYPAPPVVEIPEKPPVAHESKEVI